MTDKRNLKPLGHPAYGRTGHMPGSRVGPGDHHVHEGQARYLTVKTRDKRDRVIVQPKLDGSCVSVARIDGQILALGRAGYLATTSPFEMHHHFAAYVRQHEDLFREILVDGERLVGEWLGQAHGTLYDPGHPNFRPWVIFDLMVGHARIPAGQLLERLHQDDAWKLVYATPTTLLTDTAVPLPEALEFAENAHKHLHGGLDAVEGVVYRMERDGKVEYLAKFVVASKVDGLYLPSISGKDPVWHWRPSKIASG